MDLQIKVKVNRVVLRKPNTGWSIIDGLDEQNHQIKCTGVAAETLSSGETLTLTGSWQTNSYGKEFKFVACAVSLPSDNANIARYLGSGIIPLVGPEMANRIASAFGSRTFDILENHPDLLQNVEGIGQKRAANISEAWKSQSQIKHTMVFLHGLGIGPSLIRRIFEMFGTATEQEVRRNPYRLIDFQNVGFKTADGIALKIGFNVKSAERISAAIRFVLDDATSEGHCFLHIPDLEQRVRNLVGIQDVDVREQLAHLQTERKILLENDKAYSFRLWQYEQEVASRIIAFAKSPCYHEPISREYAEKRCNMKFSDEQWKAVSSISNKNVLVVTGGPGTGKSTCLVGMVELLDFSQCRYALVAPTGRAAKRMSQATNRSASTIHRYLGYDGNEWLVNSANPLTDTTIIVDESSMVDIELMYRIMSGMGKGCQLVLVGDVDQLPSVGPGNVLRDLINCNRIPVVRLTHIFRQALTSMIVTNAHNVRVGKPCRFQPETGQGLDFLMHPVEDPAQITPAVLSLLAGLEAQGRNPFSDIQVLTPMHKGPAGTLALNSAIQQQQNPNSSPIFNGSPLHLHDKVIQTRNNYKLGVFNGDIGTIERTEKGIVYVKMDGGVVVPYENSDKDDLMLAYCLSVHKYQGCEVPVVIFVVHRTHYIMLMRNLLYTGITRGKKEVHLVGQLSAIDTAIFNNAPIRRNSTLIDRILAK